MSSSRVGRILSLINLLQDTPRPLSAAEIHSRVPGYPESAASFHRQFERDKDELREMNLPLLMEPVPASDPPTMGYRLDRQGLDQPAANLDEDELEALNLAAAMVGFTGGLGQRAVFKLGGAAARVAQRIEVTDDPNLVSAFSAVVDRCRLRFGYRGEIREIDPVRIEFARGRWYLNGHDHDRDAQRWFRVGRMEAPLELDSPGSASTAHRPTEELTLDPWALPGENPPFYADVWFDSVAAIAVRGSVPDVEVVSDDEAGLVLRLEVHNTDGFRSWLLTFLDRAEVLSPPEQRKQMYEWLTSVVSSAHDDLAPRDGGPA